MGASQTQLLIRASLETPGLSERPNWGFQTISSLDRIISTFKYTHSCNGWSSSAARGWEELDHCCQVFHKETQITSTTCKCWDLPKKKTSEGGLVKKNKNINTICHLSVQQEGKKELESAGAATTSAVREHISTDECSI